MGPFPVEGHICLLNNLVTVCKGISYLYHKCKDEQIAKAAENFICLFRELNQKKLSSFLENGGITYNFQSVICMFTE